MDNYKFNEFTETKFKAFAKELRESLKIKYVPKDVDEKLVNISNETLLRLMKQPMDLLINDNNELYFLDGDKDVVLLDPKVDDQETYKNMANQVTEILPEFPFDLEQGGNKRKQKEVIAAYKSILANKFCDNIYERELNEVIKNYDFETCRSKLPLGPTFVDVLKLIQEDANATLKFLFNCMSIIVAERKEKNAQAYIGIVSQEDQKGLEAIEKHIVGLENDCNDKVKVTKGKLERLELIRKKDEAIENYLKAQGKRFTILHKINRLNSSNLSQIDISRVKKEARSIGIELLESGELIDEDYYKRFVERMYKKALRAMVKEFKKEKFKAFAEGVDLDSIIPKN